MRTIERTRLGLFSATLALLCAGAPLAPAQEAADRKPDYGESAAAAATTAFATDLYQLLGSGHENLFFSPWSIVTALATVDLGARGPTADEMGRVLHLGAPAAQAARGFRDLRERLAGEAGPTLRMADSLWMERTFPLRGEFVDASLEQFGAQARDVDFKSGAEAARAQINAWASDATQGRIPALIGQGGVTRDTRLVVCSAIYFKGTWGFAFDTAATYPQTFFSGAGEPAQVPMMHQREKLELARVKGARVLSLPYAKGTLSMVIVLPDSRDGLADIERSLKAETVTGWLDAVNTAGLRMVDVALPSFRLSWSAELARPLVQLGMRKAFSPVEADFSGISAAGGLQVSEVIHKAFIEVDERGTEAAAATATEMKVTAAYHEPEQAEAFTADHPFLFLIREYYTGEVLFWGRLEDPR